MTRIYFAVLLLAMCALSQAADTNYMRTTIQQHFSKIRHYTAGLPYKMAAKKFILDEFTRFGMTTVVNNYQDNTTPGMITNVVGIIKGRNFGTVNDKIVGVGAHYDTVATSPGVDDNGAGMAAMLEVARQVTTGGYQRNNTVLFAAFDAEEEQLTGSKHFIDDWLNPWLAKNYGNSTVDNLRPYGVIVLDTIMEYSADANSQHLPITLNLTNFQRTFPEAAQHLTNRSFAGDFLSLIYRRPDDARDKFLATAFQKAWSGAKKLEFKLESFPLPSQDVPTLQHMGFGDFLRSDHAKFWEANIPGIYLTDTANYRGKMIQCYHKACDNISNMMTHNNTRFLSKTADAIATTVDALSVKLPGTGNGSAAASPSILAAILCCAIACLHRTA